MTDDLTAFVRARLDEVELWATEASRERGAAVPTGGLHWQWVEPETDTPVDPDPTRGEHLTDDAGNFRFSLRSVEEFSTATVGPLPQLAISSAEEIPAAVAGHIVRHDPARVLAEVDAKRRILDEVVPEMDSMTSQIHGEWGVGTMDPSTYESLGLLRLLALPYAGHPDYREEWKP